MRVRSVHDTLSEVLPICDKIGVTRICDITYLDKLYIPNYSAVLPGTQDTFWVYSGKGHTKAHAITSALMESIERYCSLYKNTSKRIIRGTYSELSKSYHKVLHPEEVVEPVKSMYDENKSIVDYIKGYDLLKEEEVIIPAQLVFSNFGPSSESFLPFHYSHTNGLASGNVIEEAICHGMCEVIERDAASIADLCASSIPYTVLEKISKSIGLTSKGMLPGTDSSLINFVDDASLFSDVDISEIRGFESLKFLIDRFADTRIPLMIKDITQKDIGIPTFVASSVEWITSNYAYFALGYGTHLDSRVALMRAITELSQTRAVNIQGARDDLKQVKYDTNDQIHKRKWQFMPATNSKEKRRIMFSEVSSYVMDDLLDEIKFILGRLKKSGLKRVIIVNLTNHNVGIPVVRVIVPGLETMEVGRLYTNKELVMGKRGKNCFKNMLKSI